MHRLRPSRSRPRLRDSDDRATSGRRARLGRPDELYRYPQYARSHAIQHHVELSPVEPPPPYEEFLDETTPAAVQQSLGQSQEYLTAPRNDRLKRQPSIWVLEAGHCRQEQGWQSSMDLATRPSPQPRRRDPVARTMNQGAALCDRAASAVNDLLVTAFDRQEHEHREESWDETARAADSVETGTRGGHSRGGINIVDFKKTWLYGNSRLPPHLPPSKIYLPTWQLICSAAQASMEVYRRPKRDERQDYIEADSRTGAKAMCIKSRPVDDKNLIVIAIRGSKWNLVDWAVNFRSAPTEPRGFLDDEGNACHAGFLDVARAMITPVAARLRELIEQNPSRASSSLVITGHSAGGAVASLLYMHMLSMTIVSDLTNLTGIFKRVHCIVFGTPPLSLLPLRVPSGSKNVFMHFVNEGDIIVRADKEYMKTLAGIIAAPAPIVSGPKRQGLRQQFSRQTLKTSAKVVTKVVPPRVEVSEAALSIAGKITLLREPPLTSDRATEAVQVTDADLRQVVFGDVDMHSMELYQERINQLAIAAITGVRIG